MKAHLDLLPDLHWTMKVSADICADCPPAQGSGVILLNPIAVVLASQSSYRKNTAIAATSGRALLGQLSVGQHQQLGLLEDRRLFASEGPASLTSWRSNKVAPKVVRVANRAELYLLSSLRQTTLLINHNTAVSENMYHPGVTDTDPWAAEKLNALISFPRRFVC